jgi:hypothetical protein
LLSAILCGYPVFGYFVLILFGELEFPVLFVFFLVRNREGDMKVAQKGLDSFSGSELGGWGRGI